MSLTPDLVLTRTPLLLGTASPKNTAHRTPEAYPKNMESPMLDLGYLKNTAPPVLVASPRNMEPQAFAAQIPTPLPGLPHPHTELLTFAQPHLLNMEPRLKEVSVPPPRSTEAPVSEAHSLILTRSLSNMVRLQPAPTTVILLLSLRLGRVAFLSPTVLRGAACRSLTEPPLQGLFLRNTGLLPRGPLAIPRASALGRCLNPTARPASGLCQTPMELRSREPSLRSMERQMQEPI